MYKEQRELFVLDFSGLMRRVLGLVLFSSHYRQPCPPPTSVKIAPSSHTNATFCSVQGFFSFKDVSV